MDVLSAIQPGPEPVPAGDYAMWLPSDEEPSFAASQTRREIGALYAAARGVETYLLAAVLRRLGAVEGQVLRVGLPAELTTFPVLGPEGRVFILSASAEKGIRLHFHRSTPPPYRHAVLAALARVAVAIRDALERKGGGFDDAAEHPPQSWWALCESATAQIEEGGEPVEAVGQVMIRKG
jgi:hypothetical protein